MREDRDVNGLTEYTHDVVLRDISLYVFSMSFVF